MAASSSFTSHRFLGLRLPSRSPTNSPPTLPSSPCSSPRRGGSSTRISAVFAPPANPAAASAAPPVATLYDVLGVPAGATGREIKAAYRRLARACHPDVVATERKGASADEFMRIHAAYATLSDPGKRADYDRRMTAEAMAAARRRRPQQRWGPSSPGSSFYSSSSSYSYSPNPSRRSPSPGFPGGSSRRTWETDQCW